MHPNTRLLALSAAALLSRSSATPISAPPTVHCEDVTTGLDQICLSKLNMTGWMNNWGATSNIDAPVSIEDPSGELTTHPPTQTGPSDGQTSVTVGDFSNGNSFRRKRAPAPSAVVASTPSASVGASAGCNAAELPNESFTLPLSPSTSNFPQERYDVV